MDFENQVKDCIIIIITLEGAASLMLHPMISRLIGVIKAKTVVLFCKFGDHSKFRVTSYSYCKTTSLI